MAHMSEQSLKSHITQKMKGEQTMATTIMATINGVQIPVEVSEEELKRVSAESQTNEETLRERYQTGYADGTYEGAIEQRKWIIDTMTEWFDTDGVVIHDSDEYFAFVDGYVYNADCEMFASEVADGSLKKAIEEFIEKNKNKKRCFKFDIDLKRTVTKTANITVTIIAETEEEANDYLDMEVDREELADLVDEDDWELDDDEVIIDDYYLDYECDKEEAENILNED